MKRRKTAPEAVVVPSSPWSGGEGEEDNKVLLRIEKRGNGKDGQDVWPVEVESAFHTGKLNGCRTRSVL